MSRKSVQKLVVATKNFFFQNYQNHEQSTEEYEKKKKEGEKWWQEVNQIRFCCINCILNDVGGMILKIVFLMFRLRTRKMYQQFDKLNA